jgi:hypothetical protein
MVKDANHFHHFENGAWTIGDSSNVSSQSLYHILSGYSKHGSVTLSKFTSVIKG